MKVMICPLCREKFQCKENSSCWCYELPHSTINEDDDVNCICPQCLEVRIGK